MIEMKSTITKKEKIAEKGMAIAGITVGLIALGFCLFAYNWFTCLLSCIGLVISGFCLVSKKTHDLVTVISIFCSSIALIIGLIVSPEVITSNILFQFGKIIVGWSIENGRKMQAVLRQLLGLA